MTSNRDQGKLVIISGPSGAGKSTIVRKLIDECSLPLVLSVSATTRPPRDDEIDGINYHFLSGEHFERLRNNAEFLEHKEVFGRGHWYGTLRSEVTTGLAAGKWVVLEIDVEGAMSVLDQIPDAITLFIHPGSLDELERRLRGRGSETEQSIHRRLDVARHELTYTPRYKYEIINDDVDRAVQEICDTLEQENQ